MIWWIYRRPSSLKKFESEVPGEFIGKLVMDGLRENGRRSRMSGSPCLSPVAKPPTSFTKSKNWRPQNDCIIIRSPDFPASPTVRASPARPEMITIEIAGNSEG